MALYLEDIRQGNSVDIKIDYGTGFDVTGWKFSVTLSLTLDPTTPEYTQTVTAGDHALDDVLNGTVYIEIPASATDLLETGKYYYALKSWDISTPEKEITIAPPVADYKDRVLVVDRVTAT